MHGASHEVLGRLAVGGMAELYLARTTHADGRRQIVVLKRILPHLSEDPEFVRMFRDEAFLAATLDHPNIVHVFDIGQDGEDYFFTMEYVHGENVRTIIKAAQKQELELPLEHVIQIALGVCEGLHYAHERVDEQGQPLRIVHRDVSPTNILVSFDGDVKIVDFGIAKAAAATHVTQAGMLKGKASYMSPEQCRAEAVDRRSDVFAIGILVYEMTTLTRLFRGDNELAVLHQILTGTVEPPSTRVDDYPPDLERVVMKALAQKPNDRYPTALAMHEDLLALARSRGLRPSREGLGELVRELCGERPQPWDPEDEQDEPDAQYEPDEQYEQDEPLPDDETGMPTTMGNFEDEEDTQVNRRQPELRTLVPGGVGWGAGTPEEETTGATNRRVLPQGDAPPRAGAKRVGGAPGPALPGRGGLERDAAGRLRLPGKGLPKRLPSSDTTVPEPGPAPGGEDEALTSEDGLVYAETTTPMAKPGFGKAAGARGARGAAPEPVSEASLDPRARRGRTLSAASGGFPGRMPVRSGRTVSGIGGPGVAVVGPQPAGAQEPAKAPMVAPAGQSPLPGGGADRTMSAGAGSRPRAIGGGPRPGRRAAEVRDEAASDPSMQVQTLAMQRMQPAAQVSGQPFAPAQPQMQPGQPQMQPGQPLAQPQMQPGQPQMQPGQPVVPAERTMPLSAEQARAMAQQGAAPSPMPSAWTGPGVDRTELATPGQRRDVDEAARTVAMQRFDRAQMEQAAAGRQLPRGPMAWGDGQDPLTRTQRTPPSESPLTSTQKSPVQSLTSTQRSPSAAYPPIPVDLGPGLAPDLAELRRPEMRSPAPRPPSTPRSLWVPVLIVLIVALASTAAWLWLANAR